MIKTYKSKKKSYLVAGGAGFIGSHLVERLLKERNKVTVVDDLSTGSANNIAKFKDTVGFEFRKEDVCNYNDSDSYDFVINLACPASPVHYQTNPINTMLTNVQGTYNLLGFSFLKGARFLQASTSEVYGDPSIHPQPESYWGNVNCYGPRACYDEGKRAAETLVYDFQRAAQLDARIVRIFNTYGPNMAVNDGRVVSNFIVQALKGNPITIYGDGQQTRSFCYVTDTVDAILKTLHGSYAAPLNVGNPNEYTMMELAQAVLEAVGASDSQISYFTLPQDDPKQRKPDISKIYELYGWEPTIMLDKGLSDTVQYFRTVVNSTPIQEA